MTEITAYQQAPAMQAPQAAGVAFNTVTTTATQNTVDLVAWANELGAAHTIASAISQTEFVPKDFRGDAAKTATGILYGKSVGLDPLAALSNIFVVHGRPAMYSRTMVALAQRAGVEFERIEATEQQVTVKARRRGAPNWQSFTWSIARAERAGYTSNAKYKTDPIGMLTAKAFTEAVRVIAPDVLMGISVSEEVELGDYEDSPAPDAKAVTAGAKKVQRKAPAKTKAEPATPPAPVVTPPAESEQADPETGELPAEARAEVKYASKADQGRIKAGFGELGVTDAKEILGIVRDWVNDPSLRGAASLTHDQAQAVLTRLAREIEIEKANAEAPAQ
ncbi:hypothetical protein ACN08Y_10390 [Rothia sp. P5764]|uniref:hypothetical protein n=1 Tax=Rothia sp. P5764 TaxID=3402654 RepID=UPI003AC53167